MAVYLSSAIISSAAVDQKCMARGNAGKHTTHILHNAGRLARDGALPINEMCTLIGIG